MYSRLRRTSATPMSRYSGGTAGTGDTNGATSAARLSANRTRVSGESWCACLRNCATRRDRRSGSRATSTVPAQDARTGGSTKLGSLNLGTRSCWL
nr:hypothetical protein BJQ95_02982 [Cryobacterium sp. SO1]